MIKFTGLKHPIAGSARPAPPSNGTCVAQPEELNRIQAMVEKIDRPFGRVYDPSPEDARRIFHFGKDFAGHRAWPANDSRVDPHYIRSILTGKSVDLVHDTNDTSNGSDRRLAGACSVTKDLGFAKASSDFCGADCE